jgi:hypothetical protein
MIAVVVRKGLARVGVVESDYEFQGEPEAFGWRVLERQLEELESAADNQSLSLLSPVFEREVWAARAAVEDAIGLVVADLRKRCAKKTKAKAAAPPAPVERPKKPRGSYGPRKKKAEERTPSLPGVEHVNGALADMNEAALAAEGTNQ